MENLVGELDIPSYTKSSTSITTPTTSNLRTCEKPPGFSLGESGNCNNDATIPESTKTMTNNTYSSESNFIS